MDIPVNSWEEGKKYSVNDIVRVGPVDSLGDQTISSSAEVNSVAPFSINPNLDYSVRGMVKKGTKASATEDPYKTFLTYATAPAIDVSKSIGVGVGIIFYDENMVELEVADSRDTHRLMASSELSNTEYYNVQLYIKASSIPSNAAKASIVVFVYGWKVGSFIFKQISAENGSRFFYCTKGNTASAANAPNEAVGAGYWTQDFLWRPTYGPKAEFAAINQELKMGEGADYVTNLAINSLPLQLGLNFTNRTDKEARAIIHFLQEKFFPYESIFAIDYKGDRLLSSEVGSFSFKYTYPYREDLKFTCVNFNQSKESRNNNNIKAVFICNTESTLRNVESHAGYNQRTDVLFPIVLDEATVFTKGVPIKLKSFSPGEGTPVTGISEIALESAGVGSLTFSATTSLEVGDCLYMEVTSPEDSVFNVGLTKVTEKPSPTKALFAPILSSGDSAAVTNASFFSVIKLDRCPEDCGNQTPIFPPDLETIDPIFTNPATGEAANRVVYLKNYRKIQIDSIVSKDSSTITVTPLETFTLSENFDILIPAVRGRSSIYLKNPDEFVKFPWLKVRNFDHKASEAFDIPNTPKAIQSAFLEYYKKFYKVGINQNLFTLNVTFDKRSDTEAAEILQFLEAHLGYQKFRFQLPRSYVKDESYLTTQARPYMSTFYCPSWGHTVDYKNNHTITATFIESATSIEEDLRSVFGIGRDEERLCYGASIYDPITTFELCTFSAALEVALGRGFKLIDGEPSVGTKNKSVDLIFVLDGSGSMRGSFPTSAGTFQKYKCAVDCLRKIVMAYDDYVMPGTISYGGVFDTPAISFGNISGDTSKPPWPVNANQQSLVMAQEKLLNDPTNKKTMNELLEEDGYNTENLDRFKIRIDQKRVNIGMVYFIGSASNKIDVSNIPESFSKKWLYDKLTENLDNPGGSTNCIDAMQKTTAQLFNSARSEQVTDRIIVLLSDGFMNGPGDPYASINLAKALRKNGALAKRRPSDAVLKQHNVFNALEKYKTLGAGGNNQSQYRYEDKGVGKNPDWYEQEIPTSLLFGSIGPQGGIAPWSPQFASDYEEATALGKSPQFYFPITDGGAPGDELKRLLDLIKIIEILTSDSGYENIFSITLHNCGPKPVEILNSIIGVESEVGQLKYTTEFLKGGIPKGGSPSSLQYILDAAGSYKIGNGGQYFNDPDNENLLKEGSNSNILWHAFNTTYEIYRGGVVDATDPWINHPNGHPGGSEGVNNTGVAKKGMPVRVFKTSTGMEVVDYNIGNVSPSTDPAYKGDYGHLPPLAPGENMDLFFGIRSNRLSDFAERIQIFINSDDGTAKQMDCFGNIEFRIKIPSSKEGVPTGPIIIPDVLGCTDNKANNFNELATKDDGSCTYDPPPPVEKKGCTDSTAKNYDSSATVDDGSCTYDVESGCVFSLGPNGQGIWDGRTNELYKGPSVAGMAGGQPGIQAYAGKYSWPNMDKYSVARLLGGLGYGALLHLFKGEPWFVWAHEGWKNPYFYIVSSVVSARVISDVGAMDTSPAWLPVRKALVNQLNGVYKNDPMGDGRMGTPYPDFVEGRIIGGVHADVVATQYFASEANPERVIYGGQIIRDPFLSFFGPNQICVPAANGYSQLLCPDSTSLLPVTGKAWPFDICKKGWRTVIKSRRPQSVIDVWNDKDVIF